MNCKLVGFLILCGGKSKRMGIPKLLLEYNEKRFVDYLLDLRNLFCECLISSNEPFSFPADCKVFEDDYKDYGPLEGLRKAFSESSSSLIFVVPCDMPFVSKQVISFLVENYNPSIDALIPVDPEGKKQYLVGIYNKRTLKTLKKLIESGEHRVKAFLECINTVYLNIPKTICGNSFKNINTIKEFKLL